MLAGDEIATGGFGVAEALVAAMEVLVEVAPSVSVERWRLAAAAIGTDVAA